MAISVPLIKFSVILLIFILSTGSLSVHSADADPLQDFCVAVPAAAGSSSSTSTMNGLPCTTAVNGDASFRSSLLRAPSATASTTTTLDGVSITAATAASFPALNTQGISLTRIDFHPGGLLPPHVHPRAAEVMFVVSGSLQVGFVDTSNNHFSAILTPGDLFVFPRGLVHYALNTEAAAPALTISGLDSQNPGASLLPQALFTSSPPLPNAVLEKAFAVSDKEVELLRSKIPKATEKY